MVCELHGSCIEQGERLEGSVQAQHMVLQMRVHAPYRTMPFVTSLLWGEKMAWWRQLYFKGRQGLLEQAQPKTDVVGKCIAKAKVKFTCIAVLYCHQLDLDRLS